MQRVLAQIVEGMSHRAMNAPDQQPDDRKLDRRDEPFALLRGHGGRRRGDQAWEWGFQPVQV